jgi:3'-phosphoadenosine 5'-phosphosulfate (PAPS) 3'-phosphatase
MLKPFATRYLLFPAFATIFIMVHIQPSAAGFSSSKICINQLLSTCIDASLRGAAEIRRVERKRLATGNLEQGVTYKDVTDPKSALTEADGAAQAAIVQALIQQWGNGLEIIGEEDEEEDTTTTKDVKDTVEMRRNLCSDVITDNDKVPLSDVTVFIDPLDGTREFTESRLSNCQTLIGITLNRQPVAGVQCIPFPDGTLNVEPTVVYGHIHGGHGVYGTPLMKSNTAYDNLSRPLLATGDSQAPVMVTGRKIALEGTNVSNVLYGGAGNKILATAAGHVDATIQQRVGGPWDLAAPEAIIRAMGGRITTWTGEDLIVTHKDAPSYVCKQGYVATGRDSMIDHDKLVASLRESQIVQDYLDSVKLS